MKLTVIGGGSTYTPELLDGFIVHQDELTIDQISLYDIQPERLDIVGGLAQRMFRHSGLSTKIELTLDRKAAIEGAEFVVSQIRVGLMPARILDERIPLSHHVLGQETVGAGGLFNAFRTIPVALQIARDVAELAPDAWFLNFTNPSGIITEALLKHSLLKKVVGLCNVPINSQRAVADLLDIPEHKVWLDWVGLNHLGWIRAAYVDGRDRLPEVLERLMREPSGEAYDRFPFEAGLLSSLGLLPTYYLRYYYETPQVVADVLRQGKTRGEVVLEIENSLLERYCQTELYTKPPELSQRGGSLYSEVAYHLIYSILSDRRDVQIVIQRNNGAIAGLPDDAAVEVPAVVGAHGITPLAGGQPPTQVRYLLEAVKTSESLAVEAAMTGSRKQALHALLANPLVPSYQHAKIISDELMAAHRDYLPQFYMTRELGGSQA